MTNPDLARITFLVEPKLKAEFEELCSERDITLSQFFRQQMKAELARAKEGSPTKGRQSKE